MKLVLLALFFVAYPLTAISQESSDSVFQKLEKIDQFVWTAPLFLKDASLKTAKGLGVLQHEVIKKEPNQYIPGEVLEYRTLVFEGLTLYGRVEKGSEFHPITITLTKDNWKLRDGLNVGTVSGNIARILGTPMETSHNILKYQGESEQVYFHVKDGKITKIELIYYQD